MEFSLNYTAFEIKTKLFENSIDLIIMIIFLNIFKIDFLNSFF